MAVRGCYSGSSGSESSVCSSGSGGSWSTESWSGAPLRSVQLTRRPNRPDHQEAAPSSSSRLGFSLRGGSEHGTGFFVTAVQPHSEAHRQRLMVGDQIIRVNGYPLEGATHREVLQLIQRHNVVTLKVKAVGMIPVKENPEDELTWRVVERELGEQQDHHHHGNEHHPEQRDVRILLKVPPKAKLGCGICKGPDWKPGMFVQFTKENSIARNAGLRPGDQILQCNNVVFTPDTPFNEAVSVLKWSGSLELLVRKGGGADLFPGESSGYNSSASSQAGDTNTNTNTLIHTGSEGKTNGFTKNENGRTMNGLNRHHTQYTNGSTVIRVGGPSDHKMQNTNTKLAEICMLSQQLETKTTTVLVEVHHSEEDDVSHSNSDSSTDRLTNSCSISSFTSSASSLNSAISQEIERRSKRASAGFSGQQQEQQQHKDKMMSKSGLDKEKVEQHEQLMQEFKRAHRKMFSSSDTDKLIGQTQERQEEKQLAQQNKRVNANASARATLSHNSVDNNTTIMKRQFNPPPPPPLPSEESGGGKQMSSKSKKYPAPPPPPASTSSGGGGSNSTVTKQAQGVDMQSLESFKLTNPSVGQPKPPDTYFNNTNTLHNHMRGRGRPVVRISEYCAAGGERRKSPGRLDFLHDHQQQHQQQPTFQSELSHTLSRANLITKNEPIVSGTVVSSAGGDTKPFYLEDNKKVAAVDSGCCRRQQGSSVTFNFNRKSPASGRGGTSNVSRIQVVGVDSVTTSPN